jgi:hypothetical protein
MRSLLVLVGCAVSCAVCAAELPTDVVIYGGTSGGIAAAVQAARMNRSVVLIEPSRHLGGLTSGGLGATDIGNKKAIGGIAREFYQRIFRYYTQKDAWSQETFPQYRKRAQGHWVDADTMWGFEPRVAETVLRQMLAEAGVTPVLGERLDRKRGVCKQGARIASITMQSGRAFAGRMFIDATYEGDLMAAAGVEYTVGREPNAKYGETLNGVQTRQAKWHQFETPVDPYVTPGDPRSGLLPGVHEGGPGKEGEGDRRVQAYNFRMCLTDLPENRRPFPKPANYDPLRYELLLRYIEAGGKTFFKGGGSPMPNQKTDTNNDGPFSTDDIGANYEYPDGDEAARAKIIADHRDYQLGLMWTLANHPRVPAQVRKAVNRWGLAKDEFTDNDNWPHQIYVREARRMVSSYVMQEQNCRGKRVAEDPVGLAAYTMDSHNTQRYADAAGHARNEGDVEIGGFPPYAISYRSIVPKASQCTNLLVPVCLSASHIAYGSIRMEPVFMVLGQSSATAAAQAIKDNCSVQSVAYPQLRDRLVNDKQVLVFANPAPRQASSPNETRKGREATPAVVNPAIRSDLRSTLILDGPWDFTTDPKHAGESEGWYLPEKSLPSSRKIAVPGCWEAQGVGKPGLSNANNKWEGTESGGNMDRNGRLVYDMANIKMRSAYTGAAWYKKTATIPRDWAGRQIWLKLGGVNCQGWIWVNGKYIAHNCDYCGTWKYNVTDLVTPGRETTIAVLVRNDIPSRRGTANFMRVFGGLTRSVELEATPAISIDNAFVEPLFDQKTARVHVTIRNTTAAAASEFYTMQVNVTAIADHRAAGHATKTMFCGGGSTTEMVLDVNLDPFMPWSPEGPSLYKAELVLKLAEKPIDGWVERFGMKKYEVRGGDLFLNNSRYYLRGYGDDSAYPITVCSPGSRREHAKHLQMAKQYGFNYVRHHTHCEIPEFFEAADELGIMVQAELPYTGATPRMPFCHASGAPITPKEDLAELITHMRRYTSLSVYSGGNERTCPPPLDTELYQLAKKLDPSRLWVCKDGGGNNSPQNSDVNHWFQGTNLHRPMKQNVWPHVLHEYMNIGINEDPRLEPKYTGVYQPNKTLKEVQSFTTEKVGLPWKWAESCFDAGFYFQKIYQKMGIEAARIDPYLDGFSFWLLVDCSPSAQPGVLDMFWEPKKSLPEYFRQFNAPTVILAKTTDRKSPELLGLNPATLIYTSGDTLTIDWVVSHFQPKPIENGVLAWQLVIDDKPAVHGAIEGIDVSAGSVPVVGRSQITMPALAKAVKAKLTVKLNAMETSNSWDIWVFPKFLPRPDTGKDLAASPRVFERLAPRYPGLVKLSSPEAKKAKVVVIHDFREPGMAEALEQGKSVICLSLPGYSTLQPGTQPGWWDPSHQTGTAIAVHPAFGNYPHEGYLDQGWFRLVGTAERLDPGHKFRTVEPLMLGIGRADGYRPGTLGRPLGFNLYAFQARVGNGKLLATGLNLASQNPEAVYLLDQFLQYAHSDRFAPTGTFTLLELQGVGKNANE